MYIVHQNVDLATNKSLPPPASPGPAPKRASNSAAPEESFVELLQGSKVKPTGIDWEWDQWLALRKLHLLAGEPGVGKTTVASALGATMTVEGRWPDGSYCKTSRSVVMWSNEDDIEDTLIPRFMANGADMSRVYFVDAVNHRGKRRSFDPAKDLNLLKRQIAQIGDVGLVIVDSAANLVNGDSHKNNEVRKSLQPLVDAARELNFCALGLVHFNKGTESQNPLNKIVGSVGFGGMARLVMAAAIDPEDSSKRLLVRVKSNIGQNHGGFRYKFAIEPLPNHPDISATHIEWIEPVEGNAKDLLGIDLQAKDANESAKVKEAKEFLGRTLADGMLRSEEVFERAKEAGIAKRTLDRAKADLKVTHVKPDGSSKWYWMLNHA